MEKKEWKRRPYFSPRNDENLVTIRKEGGPWVAKTIMVLGDNVEGFESQRVLLSTGGLREENTFMTVCKKKKRDTGTKRVFNESCPFYQKRRKFYLWRALRIRVQGS